MITEYVFIALRSDWNLVFVAKWFPETQTCEILRGEEYIELLEGLPDSYACVDVASVFGAVVDSATNMGLRCLRVSVTIVELDILNDCHQNHRETRCYID